MSYDNMDNGDNKKSSNNKETGKATLKVAFNHALTLSKADLTMS